MPPSTTDFEQLGVFYLGRRYDAAAKTPTSDLVLYDSKISSRTRCASA
ncbi:MAG: hypothetical protein QM736_24220 [Vicinamibacterales bacterium]